MRVPLENPAGKHFQGVQAREALHQHQQKHLARQSPRVLIPRVQRALLHVPPQCIERRVGILYRGLVLDQAFPLTEGEERDPLGAPTQHIPFHLTVHEIPVHEIGAGELRIPQHFLRNILDAQHNQLQQECS